MDTLKVILFILFLTGCNENNEPDTFCTSDGWQIDGSGEYILDDIGGALQCLPEVPEVVDVTTGPGDPVRKLPECFFDTDVGCVYIND